MQPYVSALFVYPVKSCRAIALERGRVEARGLRHDRRWMIVDEAGQFVTQRTEPRLALIDVAITRDSLVLSAPEKPAIALPLRPQDGSARRLVRVWRDDVQAVDCGTDAAKWVSDWLGSRASLVFMPDDVERSVSPTHAHPRDIVGFADAFPLLLASESSLEDLSARMARPVPMDRFRPNIVVRGCTAWVEDSWKHIRIGNIPVRVAKPCSRCVVTTTDQRTAEREAEPLRSLRTFRTHNNEVLFAQNCIPDASGSIALGDKVAVDMPSHTLEGRAGKLETTSE